MTKYFKQFFCFFWYTLKSQIRTPTAWIWGFLFPIIFIILFGFISSSPEPKIQIGVVKKDFKLNNALIDKLTSLEVYEIQESLEFQELNRELIDGNLDALVDIVNDNELKIYTNANRPENASIILQTINSINVELTYQKYQIESEAIQVSTEKLNARETNYIDFVLPGILGYSLLSSAVFGVSYSFLSLRKTKVLKRIFAAPTSPLSFLLGQSLSRFIFIFLQTIIQLTIAILAFDFETKNPIGYIDMALVMGLGLFVFLSFGYLIAGIAKTDDIAAPLANLVVLPQFVLAGTFFPINTLPEWLSNIIRLMPLYSFNQALRTIALEGERIFSSEVFPEIGLLALWGVAGYFIASKVFRFRE